LQFKIQNSKLNMRFSIFISVAVASLSAATAQQQGLYNSGMLTISKGSVVYVQGNVVNANEQDINIINRGALHLTGNLVNEAGTLFRASSSGVDTANGESRKVSGGAVYFVGQDTQRIVQQKKSQGVLLNDTYHSNHLTLQGGDVNVVGGLHFNGTHHIFNGGNNIRLFEKDSIDHDLCRGYLSGERNSSRLYGSGKLHSITNSAAYWWQLDSLGVGGIPKEQYASIGAVRVTRTDSSVMEVGDGSLARYVDLTCYGGNAAVSGFSISYMASQKTAYADDEASFAIFQKNISDSDFNNRYKRMASSVDTIAKRVTAGDTVRLIGKQTSRFTVAGIVCSNPPRVSIGEDIDVCYGADVTLTARLANYAYDERGAYLYRWSNKETTEAITLRAPKPDSAYTYSVEVEDRYGCRGWDTITVRCHPAPRIDSMVVGPQATLCENLPVELYAKASGCAGDLRYRWSITKTDSAFELAKDSVWGAQRLWERLHPGAYSVHLTCTSEMGCASTGERSITVEKMPETLIAYERKSEYAYELKNESNTYSSAKGTLWLINGQPVERRESPYLHTFADTGAYTIRLVTNGLVCKDSADIPLHVMPYGAPAFVTPKSAYCTGERVQYENTSYITAPNVAYMWYFGDGSRSNEQRPTKVYALAGVYTDTLSATFSDGTEKRVARSIQVNPTPRAAFNVDSVHTCGSLYELAAGSNASYRWSTGSVAPSIIATQSGSYSVTLTSPQGCASTDSVYVLLNAKVKISLGGSRAACGSISLDAQNPGSSYRWSTGSVERTLVAEQSGRYSVRVEQANGCADSASVDISIHPLPDARLGSRSITLCENSSVTLAPTYSPENAYRWSTGSSEPWLKVEQAGVYSLSVSNATCSSADTVWVYTLPAERISLGGNRFLCNAEPTLFTLPEYLSVSSVRWYRQGAGQVSAQASYLAAEPGVYSVLATYPNGCTAADTATVEYSAAGVYVDFLVVSEAVVGDTLLLIDLSYPDVLQRTWRIDDGFSSSEKYLYHAFYLAGDKIVTLTAGNEQCTAQRSKRISIMEGMPNSDDDDDDDSDSSGGEADSVYLLPPPSDSAAAGLRQKAATYVEIEEVKVYPNPAGETFYVEVKLSTVADMLIEVYSVGGALIRRIPVRGAREHTATLGIADRNTDLYVVRVRAGSEQKIVKVLVEN
jgi:PKD repeat protein